MIRKTNPARAKKIVMIEPLAAEKRRLRNSDTSSIGCARRRSQATNTAVTAAVRANPTTVAGDVQPRSGASMMVNTKVPMATVDRTRPPTSTGGVAGSRDVGTNNTPPRNVTAATGAITTNTLPHQKCSSSQPPVIGPNATPSPVIAPHSPIARARSPRSVYKLEMIASVAGKINAAPTPITARTATSAPELSTSPPNGGGAPEHRQPGEQGALAAIAVTETPRRQHQRSKRERVRINDPLQLPRRRLELTHQRRQSNVHDRRIEIDDERSQTQHPQRHTPMDSRRRRHETTMTPASLSGHP